MLNNTATHPLQLFAGPADFAKVATYYTQRARSNEAAAAASFGWVREEYAAQAYKWHVCARLAAEQDRILTR